MRIAIVTATVLAACIACAGAKPSPLVDIDLTKGCPSGCTARAGALFVGGGLTTTNGNATGAAAGLVLPKAVTYPQAFTFEAEFTVLKTRLWNPRVMMVWDEMYSCRNSDGPRKGVQLTVYRCNSCWRPELYLGFGDRTVTVVGPSATLLAEGQRVTLRFTYDGYGNVFWHFAGLEQTSASIGATGPIASIGNRPSVGDRLGSSYQPFESALSRVRITPEDAVPVTVRQASPFAFIRGERDDSLTVEVAALGGRNLEGVRVTMEQRSESGFRDSGRTKSVGRLSAAHPDTVSFPVETRLKPGTQTFAFTVSYGGKGIAPGRKTFAIPGVIGPRLAPHMPIVAWLGGQPDELRELGFNYGNADGCIDTTNGTPFQTWYDLDKAVAGGVRKFLNLGPLYVPGMKREAQQRWTEKGEAKRYALEVSNPVLQDYAARVSRVAAERIGLHPGLGAALICSEERGTSFPSYNTEMKRFARETGLPIPKNAICDGAAYRRALKKYPTGIVPTDDPDYVYWKWFRSTGDGWPAYVSAFADEYARVHGHFEDGSALQAKRPFFTFHDPVVRWSAVWGAPGSADVANNWIYATPDPMAVAGPIEQLFACTQRRPGQKVMIMTQLICYRPSLAPKDVKVRNVPRWVKKYPNAGYPGIPPDVLQEATWSMIAKPVRGIMYHGWGTLSERSSDPNGYCCTNPETRLMLSNLLHTVVGPLGSTLMALGRRPPRVAVVESATAAALGQGYGNGWAAPHVTVFQRARLDPRVINEDGVIRDGLAGVRVVCVPTCPLLTQALADKIADFQRRGGILVGDAKTAKALKPDILMPTVEFDPELPDDHVEAAEARDRLLNPESTPRHKKTVRDYVTAQLRAEEIRKLLAARGYVSAVGSSSPDIVTYMRNWKAVPYVFAINDKRTFGDYCGMYGVIMEKGAANAGVVTVADPKRVTKAVYELARGGRVGFSHRDGRVEVPVRYETNDGRLFAFLPEEIADLAVETAGKVAPGGRLKVRVTVVGTSGKPMPAVLPVWISVADATGREMDGSGWFAARDGVAELEMPLDLDGPKGVLTVTARDRASGLECVRRVR